MKPLVEAKGFLTKVSAATLILQTYFESTSGLASSTIAIASGKHHNVGGPCWARTTRHYHDCRIVAFGQIPAVVRPSTRQQPHRFIDVPAGRSVSIFQRTRLFRRHSLRPAVTEHRSGGSRDTPEMQLEGTADESEGIIPVVPSTGIFVASSSKVACSVHAAVPAVRAKNAAELAASVGDVPATAVGDAAFFPRVLWSKWRTTKRRVGRQRQSFELPEDTAEEGRFLVMAALVGVVTGTAVTIFKTLIGAVKEFSYTDLIGRVPPGAASTYVGAVIPILGALGVVSFMWVLQLDSYGPGLGGLTEEVDRQVPWIPKRTFGKTLAAIATLGTGNSLGPEGPAVELGVASSRFVSSMSNLSVQRQRMLLGAGAAAGVAAGFNAPIAGIFFALEIVKDTFNTNYNSKSFIAATLLCAVVAALMAKIGLHDELSLRPAAYNLESPLIELPLYLGLGVVAGLVAVMFKFFSRKSADVFKGNFPGFGWMKVVPQWSKPIMMATVTGLVGVAYPQVLFFGYDTLDKLLANTGSYSLPLLCFLCVAKALLTAGALGSGLVGGTFAPSLFLGATAGAAYQRILQGALTAFRSTAGPSLDSASVFLLPVTSMLGVGGPGGDLSSLLTIAGSPAYAMVGAAAVLSALYRAPLTGSLLLFELTKDYDIVLPLMAAAGVSSLVVELCSRADAPAVQPMPRDMSLEIGLKISGKVDKLMGKIQVTDALVPRVLTLTTDTSLSEAMRAFRLTQNEFAIVVARSGFETFGASPLSPSPPTSATGTAATSSGGSAGQAGTTADDATAGWHAQTILAEDMWERRDLKLVGVLALREIILALDRERLNFSETAVEPELTAGSVCRQNCFTVKASTDIAAARRIMNLKGIRFLPVVVDLPPSPASMSPAVSAAMPSTLDTEASPARFARRRSNRLEDGAGLGDAGVGSDSSAGSSGRGRAPVVPPPASLPQAVVGVLTPESVRIAGRLTETERALRDRPTYPPPPPPPPPPIPLSPLSPPPRSPPSRSSDVGESYE